MVSESINTLPSDRLGCCNRYIRCQRSLAVKPLTMSGSPSHRGSVRRVSRSQVTHVPISNCSCSMCAMTVSKLMSTCRNNSCASGDDGRCASNGGFLNRRARRLGPFNGRRASTAGFRTLQVMPQSREARLWLVILIVLPVYTVIFNVFLHCSAAVCQPLLKFCFILSSPQCCKNPAPINFRRFFCCWPSLE